MICEDLVVAAITKEGAAKFSDIGQEYPKRILAGNWEGTEGIKFQVSGKPIIGNHFFNAFATNKDDQLNNELVKRTAFSGEYSIVCSVSPQGENLSDYIRDIASKLIKTEIVDPFSRNEDWDVDSKKTQSQIGEDLWIQLANQKYINPNVNPANHTSVHKALIEHWHYILESLGAKKITEYEIKPYANASFNNIQRLAKSIARDESEKEVSEQHMQRAMKLFTDNADIVVNDWPVRYKVDFELPKYYENKKINAIRANISADQYTNFMIKLKNYFLIFMNFKV